MKQISYLEARCQATDNMLRAVASDKNANVIIQQLQEGKSPELIASSLITMSQLDSEEEETMHKHVQTYSATNELANLVDMNKSEPLQISSSSGQKSFNTFHHFGAKKIHSPTKIERELSIDLPTTKMIFKNSESSKESFSPGEDPRHTTKVSNKVDHLSTSSLMQPRRTTLK